MNSIDEKEQNLYNATDTLAQLYGEIETFMSIYSNCMEKKGYSLKAERLRPGTMYIKNLTRRLLGSAMVVFAKGGKLEEEGFDEEEIEDIEAVELKKDDEITLSETTKIPFAFVWLYQPRTIPTVENLNSPLFITGTLGNFKFIDKKSGEHVDIDDPSLSINNLVQIRIKSSHKIHDKIIQNCWKPKKMKRYKLEAELLTFNSSRLLEIDSQEKIAKMVERVIADI